MQPPAANAGDRHELEPGVVKECLVGGRGEPPPHGASATVRIVGSLAESGACFESTGEEDVQIAVGRSGRGASHGLDVGLRAMRKGEKSVLLVASSRGFGAEGLPPTVPPHADLRYEVELLDWSHQALCNAPFAAGEMGQGSLYPGGTPAFQARSPAGFSTNPEKDHAQKVNTPASTARTVGFALGDPFSPGTDPFGQKLQTEHTGAFSPSTQATGGRRHLRDGEVQITGLGPGANALAHRTWALPYEPTFWVIWLTITFFFCLDRFYSNYFPRQNFSDTRFGDDFLGLPNEKPGTTSIRVYDVIARITSRVCMTAVFGLWFTMCQNFFNWWAERAKWVQLEEWYQANIRIHFVLGVILGIAMVPHVYFVFFPNIFDGWHINIYPGELMCCPASKRGVGLFSPAVEETNLDMDDIWRLVMVPLVFCVFIPMSLLCPMRRWSWTFCTYLHVTMGVVFTLDLLRRRTNPHSWILDLHIFLLWWVDRIMGSVMCWGDPVQIVKKVRLDERYAVIFWKRPPRQRRRATRTGDVFRISLPGSGCDIPHPFTTMSSHNGKLSCPLNTAPSWSGHKFVLLRGGDTTTSSFDILRRSATAGEIKFQQMRDVKQRSFRELAEEEGSGAWDCATIVRIYEGGMTDKLAALEQDDVIQVRGPFRASYSLLDAVPFLPPLVLCASGAGAAYLMDFVARVRAEGVMLANPVCMYYTARSLPLLQFVTDHICSPPIRGLSVHAALTSTSDLNYESSHEERDMQVGRLNINEILKGAPKDAHVYFCGQPDLQGYISRLSSEYGLHFHAGHSFGE
eukprot:TRINITY_DN55447_c0_g1_i1.p1 TRINITY_DN55447_c0_g1~~TRINITY_DN55447_c0_g1_i1.p1  ORF type:complete len:823 (+),score=231.71 TRINITY_DN55447_c0_g1_i1:75-2471(+)